MMGLAHHPYAKERRTMKSKRHAYWRNLTPVGILLSSLCLGLLAFGQSRDTSPTTGATDQDLFRNTLDAGADGKAMTNLAEGERGLVLVLVSLQ